MATFIFILGWDLGFLDRGMVLNEAAAAMLRTVDDISKRVEVMLGEEVLRRLSRREGRAVLRRAV